MSSTHEAAIENGGRLMAWRRARWLLIGPLISVLVLAGMVAFGTAAPPPPLSTISEPMRRLDLSDLPPVQRYPAPEGAMLAFRQYGTGGTPVVVLIHGSSGSSQDMHG